MAQGIFGLDRVYKKQVQNVKNDNFESWPESATYGYFGGGVIPPISYDTVDRIDFSNETYHRHQVIIYLKQERFSSSLK